MNSTRGFTLIEILIAISLVGLIGSVASTTLFNIFQGVSKTEIIKEIKQNGDSALSVMERSIRSAADITSTCDGLPSNTLVVRDVRGNAATFSCVFNQGSAKIASASGTPLTTSFLTGDLVTLGTACPGSLVFTCSAPPNNPKVVTIQFSLTQKSVGASIRDTASSLFKTTISLRNR